MIITEEEWNNLDSFYGFGILKVKEEFMLKSYCLNLDDNDDSKKILDYLLSKPYIDNSGEPIDKLFVGNIFME